MLTAQEEDSEAEANEPFQRRVRVCCTLKTKLNVSTFYRKLHSLVGHKRRRASSQRQRLVHNHGFNLCQVFDSLQYKTHRIKAF
jgi:hypothetical protein